jgi:putative holliday junction resolvase
MMIGLDLGKKRIGVAKTDELEAMAHPSATIERTNDQVAVEKVRELVLEYRPTTLVIGFPKKMNGELGAAAEETLKFGKLLEPVIPDVKIVYWDERLSTKGTERRLRELDLSGSRRRKMVDKFSAQWILEGYLTSQK